MPPDPKQFATIAAITIKLAQLGHEVTFCEPITTGPLITTYRFYPKSSTKVNQIVNCSQDIALALSVDSVLIRRLPGEAVIGISVPVPEHERKLVYWRELLAAPSADADIPLNLGIDSEGKPFRDDLTKLPHLLIAGTTGGGKSTLLHSLIASAMFWRQPDTLRFVLSDTKGVEFTVFANQPHLVKPIATSMYTTWELMDWLLEEMDSRLAQIGKLGKRNIVEFNQHQLVAQRTAPLPYIVLVIDELADVLAGGEKRGEAKIATDKLGRIVQKSRAAGVHVIAATQRPSVNIVSGSIKANFPARLTFRLPSETDSRTVIGCSGAEHLLRAGDMLYSSPNYPAVKRLHAGYAPTEDIIQCLNFSNTMQQQHQQRQFLTGKVGQA